MCTAITFEKKNFYFGRTLDLEYSYHEEVVVVPRNFPIPFRTVPTLSSHYALVGMAYVQEGFPLFYEAANEKGLCAAGLNFPQNARYLPLREGKCNLAPFELIPYLLGTCETLDEAREKLKDISLAAIGFSEALPPTPLHFLVADRTGSLVVEPMEDGLKVYENPVGVMTNNPVFPVQLERLNDYMNLSAYPAENRFAPAIPLRAYSRGMGGMGLPGDLSSASRFVKAAFTKFNSVCGEEEEECVSQFFHILGSVEQQRGCVRLGEKGEELELTVYTSCCNATEGVYYFTTYENRRIRAVDMKKCDLNGREISRFPIKSGEDICRLN